MPQNDYIINVDAFIANKNPNTIDYLCNLRVPSMDSGEEIVNRFAYTSIALTFTRISTIDRCDLWRTLHGHQKAMTVMRKHGNVAEADMANIERKLWEHLDPYSKKRVIAMARKIAALICMKNASKLWHPAYVWNTGANAGKTTAQILIHRHITTDDSLLR